MQRQGPTSCARAVLHSSPIWKLRAKIASTPSAASKEKVCRRNSSTASNPYPGYIPSNARIATHTAIAGATLPTATPDSGLPIGGVVGLRLVATSLVILQCFVGAGGLSTIDYSVVAVFSETLANLVHDGFETAVIGR